MNIYYKYTKRPTLIKGEALTNKHLKIQKFSNKFVELNFHKRLSLTKKTVADAKINLEGICYISHLNSSINLDNRLSLWRNLVYLRRQK